MDALQFLKNRKTAYQLTFRPIAYSAVGWWQRFRMMVRAMGVQQPASVDVLIDLARFCRANETTFVPKDRDAALVLAGRREVFLRIQQHLNLTNDQLFALYSGDLTKLKESK